MKTWIGILCGAVVLAAADTGSKDDKDVLAAMDAWKQATMKKDRAALERLLHEDLTYTHSNAHNESKADVLQSVIGGRQPSKQLISPTPPCVFSGTRPW